MSLLPRGFWHGKDERGRRVPILWRTGGYIQPLSFPYNLPTPVCADRVFDLLWPLIDGNTDRESLIVF